MSRSSSDHIDHIEKLIKSEKKKRKLCIIAGIIALPFLLFFAPLGIIILMAAIIIFFSSTNKLKRVVVPIVMQDVLKEVFQDYTYHTDDDETIDIESIDLDLPHFDSFKIDDHIKAKYKDHEIEIIDLELTEKQVTSHKNGSRVRKMIVFLGPLIKIDHDKTITSSVNISPHDFLSSSDIETESVRFNEIFEIHADSGHDAFYILTPQVMERLIFLKDHVLSEIYLDFDVDGHAYLAIDTRRSSFEISFDHDDIDTMKKEFMIELSKILEIVDRLIEIVDNN